MLWNGLPNTASRSDLDTERTGNIPLVISAHRLRRLGLGKR